MRLASEPHAAVDEGIWRVAGAASHPPYTLIHCERRRREAFMNSPIGPLDSWNIHDRIY
jgi:hypothetical protein